MDAISGRQRVAEPGDRDRIPISRDVGRRPDGVVRSRRSGLRNRDATSGQPGLADHQTVEGRTDAEAEGTEPTAPIRRDAPRAAGPPHATTSLPSACWPAPRLASATWPTTN